jgi:hypothetical protein
MYVFVSFVFFLLLNTIFDRSFEENEGTLDINTKAVTVDSTTYAVNRRAVLAYPTLTAAQKDSLLRRIAPDADQPQRQKLGTMVASLDSVVQDSGNLVTQVTGDSTITSPDDLQKFRKMSDEVLGTYLRAHKLPNNFLTRRLLRQSPKYAFEFNIKEFVHKVIKSLSVVMFILMPVVALLLLAVYYKKKHFYYEHLIFSVHFHTIVFIGYGLAMLLDSFTEEDNFLVAMSFLLVFYLYKSLKRVYGQSTGKTLLKFIMLGFSYGLVALLCLAGVLAYSFLYF